MSDPTVHYRYAPMSYRDGAMLARNYGYPDVAGFAADLPDGASVLDVGAGFSTLGREVADLRQDIKWLNVDLQYVSRQGAESERLNSIPSNVESLPANAVNLKETLGPRQFDRVLSYWMIPYINLAGRELGITAVRNLLEVAKPQGGKVSIGPETGLRNFVKGVLQRECTITVEAPWDEQELQETAVRIVDATTLGRFWSWMHRRANLECAVRAQDPDVSPDTQPVQPQNGFRAKLTQAGVVLK